MYNRPHDEVPAGVDYSSLSANDLLTVCSQGDAEGWTEFVRRFHPLIARVVLRVARQWSEASPQVVDDLVQETYLKLCANRGEFLQKFRSAHQNALFGYIKTFAANLAHDHFKASHAQRRDTTVTASLTAAMESRYEQSSASAASLDRSILVQQIDSCLRAITSGTKGQRDRRIFWLYYRFGLSANAIAALPSVALSTKGVETTLLRLNRQIRERLAEHPEATTRSSDIKAGNPPMESF
jgi:RNA polymerase sigma-70 factor (ECF subfamily)